MILYKYRSLGNYKYFIDIIVNNRLFAADYKSLNDPMEGMYYYRDGVVDVQTRNFIFNNKQKIKIGSLSMSSDNVVMWTHYANGHKGVVIGG